MTYRHPTDGANAWTCPLQGGPIPTRYVWTQHDRPGSFNACSLCCAVPPPSLSELNERRKLEPT